jgi:hypothetical protein
MEREREHKLFHLNIFLFLLQFSIPNTGSLYYVYILGTCLEYAVEVGCFARNDLHLSTGHFIPYNLKFLMKIASLIV